MSRQTGFQNAFNVGELGPDAWARSDLAQHSKGCVLALNMIGRVAGPSGRRPGTWFCGLTKHNDLPSRLIPFRRSDGDALVLEFGDEYARVRSVDGAPVLDGGGDPVEFVTPWTADQVAGLRWRQVGDVLYFTHRAGLRPQTLTRTSNTSWAITPTVFVDGPWRAENGDETKTLVYSGSALIAVGHAPFQPGHVGSLWRLRQNSGNPGVLSWEPEEENVPVNARRLSNGRVYARSGGTDDCGNTPPVHDGGSVSDGNVIWRFVHDGAGVFRVTHYSSPTAVTVQALTGEPDDLADGTFNWAEGAYSDVRGWPTAPPAMREERLAMAGAAAEPDAVDFTRTAGFRPDRLDFKPGFGTGRVVDDDAVRRFVGDERNRIVWLEGSTFLMAGTTDGEFVITGATIEDPISPAGNVARPVSDYGSDDVMPSLVQGGLMFVAAGGETLVSVRMTPDQSFEDRDLSVVAEHIGQRGLAELAWLKQPLNQMWVRLSDGGQATFTYHAKQGVEGWNRQGLAATHVPSEAEPLGGGLTLESLCVVPAGRGRPRLFMIASRVKGGETQRMILRLADRADRLFLDAAESYVGASVGAVAGLDHLAGETVTLMAATVEGADATPGAGWGEYRNVQTDEDGEAILPNGGEATRIYAGLPYLSRWEGLPPEMAGPGTTNGRLVDYKSIHVTIEAAVAYAGTVGDEGDSGKDRLLSRGPADTAGPVVRRQAWRSLLTGGASRDRRIFVETDHGWDMVIHAIRASADVNG